MQSIPTLQVSIPDNARPEVRTLADLFIHTCNAMLVVEDAESVTDMIVHVKDLLDDVTKEVINQDDLLTLSWLLTRINSSVISTYISKAILTSALGNLDEANRILLEQDHVIAVITQVYTDVVNSYLMEKKFNPNVDWSSN